MLREFSFRTREQSLERFRNEVFDLLIIGGGITGAAVARDAISRGLSVALVERKDFAYGTSSRSSKLIHGGLRYLQNMEFGLVFEALSERSLLLKTCPHLVRPIPFYMPVFQGDSHGRALLSLGMWVYDVLALFRAPGFHRRLSAEKIKEEIPFLKTDGLLGGFQYYDATMWDDVLAVETLRAAQEGGAAIANYVEAIEPIWTKEAISGFRVRNNLADSKPSGVQKSGDIEIKARRVVGCVGPWTDELGGKLSSKWQRWLKTSKGVHLVFDLKRIPIPGAMVMSSDEDGRVAFIMPRKDLGNGVVIVGTTDGSTDQNPEKAEVNSNDIQYLFSLVDKYFPNLKLTRADILSTYVGVRPLMGADTAKSAASGNAVNNATVLQKVSREHHIDRGPGGSVLVAGGKYTTHRKMAEEIVDFTLKIWKEDAAKNQAPSFPSQVKKSNTRTPVNFKVTVDAIHQCQKEADRLGLTIPEPLLSRYGADVLSVLAFGRDHPPSHSSRDPEGFPLLGAQFRFAIRSEMVMKLEDFYFRRLPLYMSRKDHGLPWAEFLARIWADERGLSDQQMTAELESLKGQIALRSRWREDEPTQPVLERARSLTP